MEYEAICITKNVNDDDKEGAVKYVDVEESENDKEEYFSDFLASLSDVVLIDVTVASTFIIDSASIYSLDIHLPPPK